MSHLNAGSRGGDKPSSSSTSKSLLGRARGGDARAWDRLTALYAPLVSHWCRRRGLREADVDDIVQDVFQAVAASLGRFRKENESDTFRGWLRTITENKIRDHFRKHAGEAEAVGGSELQHRLAQLPAPPEPGSAVRDDDWDEQFFLRVLEEVRGEFEGRTWQAFLRTAVEGRPPKEVGPELGMSPGAVRVAKSRVLRRLREELGALGPDFGVS
jgi:RNA polymerase sigma-70 factor (ECF subfamily)